MTETSKEYASALFDLAIDSHTGEETQVTLHQVLDALANAPGAIETLASPAIPKRERHAIIDKTWADTLPEHVRGFLQVLCSNGHIRELDSSIAAFDELMNAARKLATAEVVSAVPLTDGEREKLREQLEKRLQRTVQLECSVDESLLGGLVVTVDGKVMDGSLRHRLHEIKEVMNG